MRGNRLTAIALLVCAVLWAVIVVRKSASTLDEVAFEATVSQEQVQSFARTRLAELQQRSFVENVELCGLIAENGSGELVSQISDVGDGDSCDITYFELFRLLPRATFHTHAAFNVEYDSEVPSTLDMESDMESGIDGYISTPGGRFWRIDWEAGVARQVCGEGCLPKDAKYLSCDAAEPKGEYTLLEMQARSEMAWSGC